MTSPPPDWTDDEQGLSDLGRALGRALWRSTHHPIWVVVAALLVAAVVVLLRATAPVRYTARVTLRITESSFEHEEQRTPRNLRDNLVSAALASPRLARIVAEHKLYPRFAVDDMPTAITELRSDMSLEIVSNYLLTERLPGDPPRAARVTIGYTTGRADVAAAVARALADAIIAAENERRSADAEIAEAAVSGGQRALHARYFQAVEARKAAELEDAAAALAQPSEKTRRWLREEHRLTDWLAETEKQRGRLELMTRAQVSGLGMHIDRVYEDVSSRGGTPPPVLAVIGVVVFALSWLGAALLMGAFDPRVRDARDLAESGARVLGEVPRARRRGARPGPATAV